MPGETAVESLKTIDEFLARARVEALQYWVTPEEIETKAKEDFVHVGPTYFQRLMESGVSVEADTVEAGSEDFWERMRLLQDVYAGAVANDLTDLSDQAWLMHDLAHSNTYLYPGPNTGKWIMLMALYKAKGEEHTGHSNQHVALNAQQRAERLREEINRRATEWGLDEGAITYCLYSNNAPAVVSHEIQEAHASQTSEPSTR